MSKQGEFDVFKIVTQHNNLLKMMKTMQSECEEQEMVILRVQARVQSQDEEIERLKDVIKKKDDTIAELQKVIEAKSAAGAGEVSKEIKEAKQQLSSDSSLLASNLAPQAEIPQPPSSPRIFNSISNPSPQAAPGGGPSLGNQ